MDSLSLVDYSIVVIYFLAVILIGLVVKKKIKGLGDYFVAGRRLTLPLFVATLVSTWYGGILGVGELSFNYGYVNWLTQGAFWYLSYLFFALYLARKVRMSKLYTIPDLLEKFYDKKVRFLGAIFNFLMVTPAPYVLSLGIVFSLFFGWPIWLGIVLGTVLVIFYTVRGGFYADVNTDLLQFLLMTIGAALVIPFAISRFGGLEFLHANLPETHFTLTGTWTLQMIIVWGFLACWTLVDPGFYQRCYAAKDPSTARKGILISILFWGMFDICTTFTGMYARAAMPDIDPTTAYAVFPLEVLPVVLKGVFLAGVLATIMSTVDSFTFLGAMNLAQDLYKGVFRPQASEKQVMRLTKWGILVTAGLAMLIALYFQSLVAIWYTIGTVGISALLVPVLAGFFGKGNKSSLAAFLSMLTGFTLSLAWLIHGNLNAVDGWPVYLWGLEPLYPGLALSFLVFIVVNFLKKDPCKTTC